MKILSKDYIDLKIDTDRMTNGKEVAARLRKNKRGGIPWMVILDSEEKALITSDGPKGNIGCPVQPHEREYFLEMLRETRKNIGDEELSAVSRALEAYAETLLRRR